MFMLRLTGRVVGLNCVRAVIIYSIESSTVQHRRGDRHRPSVQVKVKPDAVA